MRLRAYPSLALVLLVSFAAACSDPPASTPSPTGTTDTVGSDGTTQLGDAKADGKGDADAQADQGGAETTPVEDVATDTGEEVLEDTADGLDDAVDAGDDAADAGDDSLADAMPDAEQPCQTDDDCTGDFGECAVAKCDTAAGKCATAAVADGTVCSGADDFCISGDTVCQAGKCTGTPTVCDDLNPCTDDSCDPKKGCKYLNNTVPCDDTDPCTEADTCAEGKCQGGANICGATESNCSNGVDEDQDGAIDCADNECAADPACKTLPKEVDCANQQDDDNDGAADCQDPDCAADVACKPLADKETACTGGVDEDKDGAIDCADNDCAADPACKTPIVETNCTDKADDDQDGKTDCADTDCAADAACKASTKEVDCKNGKDDDVDGATDCADNDCGTDLACAVTVETNCTDKLDDDKDGKVDCGDTDCAKNAACTTSCAHDACVVGVKLTPTCDSCAAAVCKADPYCCSNEWDDVCVGKVPALCGKTCKPTTEANCADKVDEDADGMTDCADADCKDATACGVAKCVADFNLACGGSDQHNNAGAGSTDKIDGYTCADGKTNGQTGSEYTYGLTAECDGPVTVTLAKTSTKQGFLDLFILDGAKACASTSCLAHSLMSGSTATKTFQAKKGQKFFVVVDGYQDYASDFTIKTTCGCAGGKEVDCGDKVDNDADGTTDCADGDCAAALACAPTETDCANKVDDDKDGKIDCADGDCAASLACQVTETNCTDKVDGDKDGKIDCLDTDCAKDPACAVPGVEGDCVNKVDDDKDGKTDCADSDCAAHTACKVTETNCTNKVDDDKDGKIDCADADCSGKTGCACDPDYPLSCGSSDNWSNNGGGSTKLVSSYTCADGSAANETGSEYTYEFTASCDGELTVTLTKTSTKSGFLDLFVLDGSKACGGATCLGHALMSGTTAVEKLKVVKGQKLFVVVDGYQGFSGNYSLKTSCACAPAPETKCGNKVDDDKDGKTDCADSDCAADPLCAAAEKDCGNQVDDDKDGKTDCADGDCAADLACAATPTSEKDCGNKLDDDKDGKTDCADSDCAANPACAVTGEKDCGNKLDDDKDGKIDCADSDCAGMGACGCKEDFGLSCGQGDTYSSNGPGSTAAVSAYTCKDGSIGNETGKEYTYGYTATCDGKVTVTLTKTATTNGYLDLFVLDGAQVCAGTSCLAHGLMSASTSKVTFDAKKDAKYRIVVDGYNGYAAGYKIDVACACAGTVPVETDCSNKADDDKDGKLDCADSDCAGEAVCAGPKNCKDDYALACGGTDSYSTKFAGTTDVVNSYTCKDGNASNETGPEYSYEYVAECTGTLALEVKKPSTSGGFLDLFVLDGAKACGGSTCLAHALMSLSTAKLSMPVTKGQKLHVVVDGFNNYSGAYDIKATCSCQ